MSAMINGKILVSWDGKYAKCRGCGSRIAWGTSKTGKKIPFDLDDNCTAHWATCPKADQFRKKKEVFK